MIESNAGVKVRESGEKSLKESLSSLKKALRGAKSADDSKAQEIVLLNVSGLASFADYFLICSGRSSRQVQGIVDNVETALRRSGVRPLGVEGRAEGHWVLMDYGDVIIHVFYDPVRHFYDLESLWSEAETIDWQSMAQEESASAERGREQGFP